MMAERLVAVTGATGFLGRALIPRLLAEGVAVRAVARRPGILPDGVDVMRADIRDAGQLAAAFRDVTVVFHLAAHVHDVRSADDTPQQHAVTLGGTLAVLEAAERTGVGQIILASSLAVFGEVGDETVDELRPCRPTSPYGRAKLAAEEALCAFTARTGALGAAIRPAMMYGVPCPGNLPRMIRSVHSGWFPLLPEFGNRRSMISVDDAAAAMVLAWRRRVAGGRPFIVTDGEAYSTRELHELILAALGRRSRFPSVPYGVLAAAARLGDLGGRMFGRRLPFDSQTLSRLAGSAHFDSSRARVELGFRPTTTLRASMPALVEAVVAGASASDT